MKYFVFVAICLAVATAVPLEVFEDENGEQYYVVPIGREKRDTNWGISDTGYGISQKGTIYENDRHVLDGSAYAAKTYQSHGLSPDLYGGSLDYKYKPSDSTAFVSADSTRHFGTDVNAGVKYNIYQDKNFGVDLTGQYGRHFGGPSGTGKPDAGVFLNAHGTF